MDENFNKFKKKLIIEHIIKSLIYSLTVGIGSVSILFVVFKRIPLILNFWVYLIIGLVLTGLVFYVLYKAYYPKDEEIAKRIDKQFNLHENVQTMVKFKDKDNVIVNMQRETTSSKLAKIPSKSLPMKFTLLMFIGIFVSGGLLVGSFFVPEKKVDAIIDNSSSSSSSENTSNSSSSSSTTSSEEKEDINDAIDKIIEIVDNSTLDDSTKNDVKQELEDLKDQLKDSDDPNKTIDDIKNEIDKIIDDANSKNRIGEELAKSEDSNIALLGEGILNIDETKISLALNQMKEEIKNNPDKLNLYANEIIKALLNSGVSSDDELYIALNNFSNSLIRLSSDFNENDLEDIFSKALQEIMDALKKQLENEQTKNEIDEALDHLKGEDGDSSDGDDGDKKDDSSDQNKDDKDDKGDNDQDKGDGDQGKDDGGKTTFGSDDKVYSKDGNSSEYGDVIDDYYSDIVNDDSGDTPDDIGDILDDYFSTLYGNGGDGK